ncbi:MAG: class I SAM-dependent methyltransferase [Methylorubrum populi]
MAGTAAACWATPSTAYAIRPDVRLLFQAPSAGTRDGRRHDRRSRHDRTRSSRSTDEVDFGCGTGRSTFALADALPVSRLFGLDATQVFVDAMKRAIAARGLSHRMEAHVRRVPQRVARHRLMFDPRV